MPKRARDEFKERNWVIFLDEGRMLYNSDVC